jgi:hypothetical protein
LSWHRLRDLATRATEELFYHEKKKENSEGNEFIFSPVFFQEGIKEKVQQVKLVFSKPLIWLH